VSRRLSAHGDGELHLARCRRRRESASVLVARIDSLKGVRVDELVARLRITDSVAVLRLHHGCELHGVFDDHELARVRVEQRLRELLPAGSVAFSWARFPDDGVTLAALIEEAREALPAEERQVPRSLRRLFRSSSTAEAEAK
jgi:hypothetical protein